MSYFDVYRKKIKRNGSNIREKRERDSKSDINRNFDSMLGYRECTLTEPKDINENLGVGRYFEVVIRSSSEELEKDLLLRPDTFIESGSYVFMKAENVNDKDRTYIVNTINRDSITPVAHSYLCNETIRIKGCPVDFPVYENSTTFGTKGIVDNGGSKFLELDSKTRAYLQYNKFTSRIPLGYRFIFKKKYVFSVTEIDHMVYDHLIVTMKITERHPNDDFENNIAWNEFDIDFSDLLEDNISSDSLIIDGDSSIRVGKTADYFINSDNVSWMVDNEELAQIVSQDSESVTLLGVSKGIVKLMGTTLNGASVSKNIIIV